MEKQNKSLPSALSLTEMSRSSRSGLSPPRRQRSGQDLQSGQEIQPPLPGMACWRDAEICVWALR